VSDDLFEGGWHRLDRATPHRKAGVEVEALRALAPMLSAGVGEGGVTDRVRNLLSELGFQP
jgi:hypothetical protein